MSRTRSQTTARRRRAGRRRAWLVAAAGVAAAGLAAVAVLTLGDGPQPALAPADSSALEPRRLDEPRPDTAGKALPDVAFETLDGRQTTLATLADDGLVINFFASWCASCLRELPHFQAIYAEHQDDVTFLGVNLQDAPDKGRELVDWAGLTYPVTTDPRGELFTALEAYAMPTTVFVRPDGAIAEVYGGELSADQLLQRMRDHELIG